MFLSTESLLQALLEPLAEDFTSRESMQMFLLQTSSSANVDLSVVVVVFTLQMARQLYFATSLSIGALEALMEAASNQHEGGIFIQGNSTRASLENITLTNNSLNSKSGMGGGLMIDDGATVRIVRLVVSANKALFGGGVTVGKECSVNLENAIITENESEYGAERTRFIADPLT